MLVAGIDEVLGDNAARHLQAGNIAVKSAAHLTASETAGIAQFARDEAAVFAQGQQDGFLD